MAWKSVSWTGRSSSSGGSAPTTRPRLAQALGRLSDESVRDALPRARSRASPARELRYLTEVDFRDHYAVVATPRERPGRDRRRRALDPRRAAIRAEAEAAIVVADHLRVRASAARSAASIADAARARGVRRFTATMLPDNVAAHRLFAAISERLEVHHDGATDEIVADARRPERAAPHRRGRVH